MKNYKNMKPQSQTGEARRSQTKYIGTAHQEIEKDVDSFKNKKRAEMKSKALGKKMDDKKTPAPKKNWKQMDWRTDLMND